MAINWFPHDSSAGMDQHVLMLRGEWGSAGYGMFWLALEAMYETSDGKLDATALPALSIRMAEPRERVEGFFRYCVRVGLFIEKDGKIYSERLIEEKARLLAKSDAQRTRAETRWFKEKNRKSSATAFPDECRGNAPTVPTPHNPQVYLSADADPRPPEVMDAMEAEFRALLPLASEIFDKRKQFTREGLEKWRARRRTFSATELREAFQNLRNEPDLWKIRNNGHRELAWWLHSDERIRDMRNCHLKKSAAKPLHIAS